MLLKATFALTCLLAAISTASGQPHPSGAGLSTSTWPAGTKLAELPHGGRITTFHRGLLYLGATGAADSSQRTWVYDISDPENPVLRCEWPSEDNSHVWYKVGDLFYRQNLAGWNSVPPVLTSLGDFNPGSCPQARQNWITPIHDFPLASTVPGDDWMATYPYAFDNYPRIRDARTGQSISSRNLWAEKGVTATNRFRIGNLLFFTPGDGQSGVAVFDIGDPANPVLLDTLTGNYKQYTTTWQVWRHYLVMMHGDDTNGPDSDANALMVDFSDPTNLHLAWKVPVADLPGRYVHFQDNIAFSGHKTFGGVKYDMETRQVVRRFPHPHSIWAWFTDFQWIPLGHLLMVSGSEPNGGSGTSTFLFTHQDGLDTTPPTVGYHLPVNGAVNQPTTSAIGLVINEQLDSTTVNDTTIQLRPTAGGDPLPAIVTHTSYDVVNIVPVQPLQDDTTYTVTLVAGGLRDIAGNAVEPYSFSFSTGSTLQVAPQINAFTVSPSPTTAAPHTVAQTLTFSVDASGATQYRWAFGDGNESGWVSGASTGHAYATPGVHVAQVQARNAAGQVASATLRVLVNPLAASPLPTASASILVDATARSVWAVNPDHGSVARFNADTRTRTGVFDACSDPRSVAVDGAHRAWVACHGDDRLVAMNAAGSIVATIQTGYGSAPAAVLFDANGDTGYAALAGSGQVLRFSAGSAQETARLTIGFESIALARTGTQLYAARLKSPDAAGEIARIDLTTFALAEGAVLDLDTTSPDSGTAGRGLPNYVAAMAASVDGSRVWYGAKKDNVLRGLAREGTELNFETTVRVMLGAIETATTLERVGDRIDVDNSSMLLALTPSPHGGLLFAALAGNDRVLALDPWKRAEFARAATGSAPRGLATDPVTHTLWVRNDLGRTVSVFDIADLATEGATSMPLLATVPTVVAEVLSAQVLAGKRIFWNAEDRRMSGDAYISCASCHLDGGGDARVWDFSQRGEGLRRTIALNGRSGMAHGPVHWSANFDEVQDFEHDIRNEFGGTGLMADVHFLEGTRSSPLGLAKAGVSAELDAMSAYVSSLDSFGRSPYRTDTGTLTADATAGRAVFLGLGCARCHGGPEFTDSNARRWHDVGTIASGERRAGQPLQGFDTPTLRGLWHESAFLHDGRAPDPVSAVSLSSSGKHGDLVSLSNAERSALNAYLLSIDDQEPEAAPAFVLELVSPDASSVLDPSRPLQVVVSTDLAEIVEMALLVDGVVVATRSAAPWQFQTTVGPSTQPSLQLRVVHASGATTFSWPTSLAVGSASGALFGDGFES